MVASRKRIAIGASGSSIGAPHVSATCRVPLEGVAVILGLIIGVVASIRPNSIFDNVSMSIVLLGVSVPDFWLGLVLMFVFSVWLGWLPITGDGLLLLILPAVALGLPAAAVIARMMRSSMLEVLAQDYIRVAKAKGLAARAVLGRHALKNGIAQQYCADGGHQENSSHLWTSLG